MESLIDLLISKIKTVYISVIVFFFLFSSFIIYSLFNSEVNFQVVERVPSGRVSSRVNQKKIDLKGQFIRFSENISSDRKIHWGNFRGPEFNNIINGKEILRTDINENNIPVKWCVELGEGYAGPAVANGSVYITDHDKLKHEDQIRAFSLETGKEIWRHSYKIQIKRNHGITRTVPAVNEKYIVSMGPKCQVVCLNSITGEYKWGIDLEKEYKTEIPLWYTGQCPLIYNNMAIIAPSGDKLILGLDLETGQTVFSVENPNKYKMSHSSVIPMKLHNNNIFLYTPISAVIAISAEPENIGEIIFLSEDWQHSIISPSPVFIDSDEFLLTAGYGGGSRIFKVIEQNQKLDLEVVKTFKKNEFACEQHTPIYYKDHLYTIMPNDAGELKKELICMTREGELKWRSGKDNTFGLGPFIITDDKIFILNDDGVLTIAEASTENYNEINEVKILQGRESWAPIAVAGTYIICRDFERMICLDLKMTVK